MMSHHATADSHVINTKLGEDISLRLQKKKISPRSLLLSQRFC